MKSRLGAVITGECALAPADFRFGTCNYLDTCNYIEAEIHRIRGEILLKCDPELIGHEVS